MQKIFIFTIGLFIGFILGISIFFFIQKSNPSSQSSTECSNSDIDFIQKRNSGNEWIKPLLECDIDHSSYKLTHLKNEVNNYLESNSIQNNSGVYYRDLNSGQWFGINEKNDFSPASLFKVFIAMIVYKQSETNPDFLQKEVVYNDELLMRENIDDKYQLEPGKSYTIEQLIEQMLHYSDNEAAYILEDQVKQLFPELIKSEKERFKFNLDYITLKEYSDLFRYLYNSTYLNETNSTKILEILSRSDFKDGIVKNLPNNIRIAHKFGFYDPFSEQSLRLFAHCGIVYKENNPYLICAYVRTSNNSNDELLEAVEHVENISKIVYDTIE